MGQKRWACPGVGNLGGRKGVSAIWLLGYVRAERQGVFVGTRLVEVARGSS